ncbi:MULTISPECIES: F0F1 ATP synthase subunit A [Devosia]|uniref:ATP synthase subunit a n=1 Tax=Devosia equisanguinis TaxID=2490941 RepID=A0A3S4CR53_9HYPH|nr:MULTISPECIES: F0F1 ATP synthase subunit A [Devosia]ODT47534.1 MAG: F0F1 ATP synthase subunit A [Pelagibacterium sp. SCN 63-126]OJX42758.1 MAG: F0F1 ATP synthase subunit A [Devosia sp. 63-57]VDS04069.1 ATP synthase subunit a [Devosia equisanguinis]
MAGTDPIHQFVIYDIAKLFTIGGDGTEGSGTTIAFTNSALFMVLTVATIVAFLLLTTSGKKLIPTRAQLVSELLYEFVAGMVRSSAGTAGMKFFPLVFSLFTFIFVANMFGMVPYFFTVTSHIIVTFALSMLVFVTVIVYGFVKNGPKFLKLFVPAGVPGYILPIVTPIEVISFLSRPISLSVRLFGNILAGHITLKVFTGFAVMMIAGLGAVGWVASILPILMAIALTGLEFLVGSVQAYVFAVLTCMYLNDAIHPSH